MKINNHWKLLTEKEQKVLLCFFPFQFVINLAQPVIDTYFTSLKQIPALTDLPFDQYSAIYLKAVQLGWFKKVIQFPNTELYQLSPFFVDFLKKQAIAEFGQSLIPEIENSFVEYYDWHAERLYDMFHHTPSEERQQNIAFLKLEYENLYAALMLSIKHHNYDFTTVFLTINTFLYATQRNKERFKLAEKLLDILEDIPDKQKDEAAKFSHVDIYVTLGTSALNDQAYQQSEDFFSKALTLYIQYKQGELYPEALRSLYQNLAAVTGYQEKWEESNDYYLKMKAETVKFKDMVGIADFHFNFGRNQMILKNYAAATDHFLEAAQRFKELGILEWQGISFKQLSTIKIQHKEWETALLYLKEALVIFETLEEPHRIAGVFNNYSIAYLGMKDFHQAEEYAKKAIAIYINQGMKLEEGLVYLSFCGACTGKTYFIESESYLSKALLVFLELRNASGLKRTLKLASLIDAYHQTSFLSAYLDKAIEVYSLEEIRGWLI